MNRLPLMLGMFAIVVVVLGSASADPLSANFTWKVNGAQINFYDHSGGVNIVKWSWNFGDNQMSSQQNPTHIYQVPDSYTVVLIITDLAGNTALISRIVEVSMTPQQSLVNIVVPVMLVLLGAVGLALSKSGIARIGFATVVCGGIVIFVVLSGGT